MGMSNAESMGSSRRRPGGTIVGFKVTLLSLVGLMVATVALQWDILVYFMILFPTGAGIVTAILVGSAGIASDISTIPRWVLVGLALLTDVIAIIAGYFFFDVQFA